METKDVQVQGKAELILAVIQSVLGHEDAADLSSDVYCSVA